MKILRPFTGTGAIFFPPGKPPVGTCEFATLKCLRRCYAKEPKHPNFDEEILIPDSEKQWIYESVLTIDIPTLCRVFNYELDGLQTPILHWFGSGDCQTKDLERVSAIISYMRVHYPNVVQMGFTRNLSLWEQHKDTFALTVETIGAIAGREGIFSVPQYGSEISVMHAASYRVRGGRCGSVTCRDYELEELEHYINCKTCLRLKTGCFDKRF